MSGAIERGMFRAEPIYKEPASCETLYMEPRWLPGHLALLNVCVGATDVNALGEYPTVSLQIVQFDKKWRCEVGAAWLTPDETDALVAALTEAKIRLLAMRRELT